MPSSVRRSLSLAALSDGVLIIRSSYLLLMLKVMQHNTEVKSTATQMTAFG
jgi:hypothetical protein